MGWGGEMKGSVGWAAQRGGQKGQWALAGDGRRRGILELEEEGYFCHFTLLLDLTSG